LHANARKRELFSQQPQQRSESAPAKSRLLLNGHTLRIMVVDDQPVILKMMDKILSFCFNCSVTTATDGLDAVMKAKMQPFDAIFMDCNMPHMDGFEATRKIRSEGQNTATPISALTANVEPDAFKKSLECGMSHYVPKPVNPAALLAALHRLLPSLEVE
jgi:CheY-like chemotaxis protein